MEAKTDKHVKCRSKRDRIPQLNEQHPQDHGPHTVPRIAVFSVAVLHDERIVVVAEQRPDSTEEDSFQWMSRVLQVAMSSLSVY